jgi:hypothetical protein
MLSNFYLKTKTNFILHLSHTGQQTKRCTVLTNNNLSVEFGLQSDSACTGSSSFQTLHNNNPLDAFTASCAPQGTDAPCRRVRGGSGANGFCRWTVTAPACKAPTTSPTKLPTKMPTKRPTKQPTKAPTENAGDGKPILTIPPTACALTYGCDTLMLNNNRCDLKCDIEACNFDNGNCGGYVHVEFTGSWLGVNPLAQEAVTSVVKRLNEIILPETLTNIPMRDLNHGACTMDTQFPGDPSGPYPNTYKTNKLIIFANVQGIDGSGGMLGQGGTCGFGYREAGQTDTAYSTYGLIRIDEVDVASFIDQARLEHLILHEICHSMGIGTLWPHYDLIKDRRWDGNIENTANRPTYKGVRGNAVFSAMGGNGPVPIERFGGRGTADGHWDEWIFDNELMTGWLTGNDSPLSALTLASFQDMGLIIDMSKADAFILPSLRTNLMAASDTKKPEKLSLGNDLYIPMQMLVTQPDGTTALVDTAELDGLIQHHDEDATEPTPGLRPAGP